MTIEARAASDRAAGPLLIAKMAARARARRFQFFLSLLNRIEKPVRVVDVGGTEAYWRNNLGDATEEIIVHTVNMDAPKASRLSYLTNMQGDATEMTFIPDQAYDIAHSNSVIEHVGT